MGIDLQLARILLGARDLVAKDARIVMLGRLTLSVRAGRQARLLRRDLNALQLPSDVEEMRQSDGFSETFLDTVGYPGAETMDMSDYEGATILHDLGQPLPAKLRGKFGVIIDGGTTEHVFDFPQALDNMFHMLAPGGVLISMNGLTGWPGHGFYQISPEMVWRYWQEMRGCTVHRCAAVPFDDPTLPFREVSDTGPGGNRFRGRNMPGRWSLGYVVQRPREPQAAQYTVPKARAVAQGDYSFRWASSDSNTSSPK